MAKLPEKIYPVIILIFGTVTYFWLVFMTYIVPSRHGPAAYAYLISVHLSLFLLVWSMVTTMSVDPGLPPVFWVS